MKTVPPEHGLPAYTCPHCITFAEQRYVAIANAATSTISATGIAAAFCLICEQPTIWTTNGVPTWAGREYTLRWPPNFAAPNANPDMPDDVLKTYKEAREVASISPRAAAALLRLGMQLLFVQLGLPGKNLNADIGELVKRGLAEQIQKALDTVRVVGNNAVHPGEMALDDNPQTVLALFEITNLIVQRLISEPRAIDDLYAALPGTALEGISKRDDRAP